MSSTPPPGPARLLPAPLLLALLAGCAAPAPEPRKELYIEPAAGEPGASASPLEPFPLPGRDEARLFVALRTLRADRQEEVELLARTLEVWPPAPPDQPGADPALPPARPDLRQQAQARRPPALMFALPGVAVRRESACYLGHAAFAVRGYGRPAVLHHVRLLVVNREPRPLRIPPGSVRCEPLASAGGTNDTGLTLDRPAVANDLGQEVQELLVPAGAEREWHLFFHSHHLDQALRLSWQVELAPAPDALPDGPWTFQVVLQRRYVVDDPEFSELERIVARGDPLPRAPRPYDPFSEPRLQPVPTPPD